MTGLDAGIRGETALAAAIQKGLRDADGANSDITVTMSNGKLSISDATQQRDITGMKLTKTVAAASDASAGADPQYDGALLKITSVDPNVTAAEMADQTAGAGLVVTQGSTTLASTLHETEFTRAQASYQLLDTTDTTTNPKPGFKAIVGSMAPIEGATGQELADNLNKNATFSASYKASYNATDKQITIVSKNPSNPSSHDIATSVKVYQNSDTTNASSLFTNVNVAASNSYTLNTTKDIFEVSFNNGSATEKITAFSTSDLAIAMGSNATFSSLFTVTRTPGATATDPDVFRITAKDPTNALSQTLPVLSQSSLTASPVSGSGIGASRSFVLGGSTNPLKMTFAYGTNNASTKDIVALSAADLQKQLSADADLKNLYSASVVTTTTSPSNNQLQRHSESRHHCY